MVQHGEEYSQAMEGRHGKQLDLAWKEGSMKHDRSQPFNPFEHYRVNGHADDAGDEEDIGIDEDIDDMSENGGERNSNEINDTDDDTDEPNDDDTDESLTATLDAITQVKFNKDGSLQMTHTTRAAAHVAGAPAGGAFVIISLGNSGIQHKVTKHDVIISNKLKPVERWAVGTTHTIGTSEGEGGESGGAGQVLLVGDSDRTCVGLPFIQGAQVDVMVEEITRDQTVIVFKKRGGRIIGGKMGFEGRLSFSEFWIFVFPMLMKKGRRGRL